MAGSFFRDRNPIGEVVYIRGIDHATLEPTREIAWTVVGVVSNELIAPVSPALTRNRFARAPTVYVTYQQSPTRFVERIAIRTAAPHRLNAIELRTAVHRASPDQPVMGMASLADIKAGAFAFDRWRTWLLASFGMAALSIALIGVYGIVAYTTTRRRHEIAIRVALGASRLQVCRLVLSAAILMTAIGVLVGFVGALATERVVRSLLFGLEHDWRSMVAIVASFVGGATMVAAAVPTIRAAWLDPVEVLRHE
jgi:putative ABC transport system permease protein